MSLFVDTLVELVEVTLTKRDASTTTAFTLGVDAYAAGALYTSSPVVYPVLVNPPTVLRTAGEQIAVRHEVSISIFGNSHLHKYENTFLDLLTEYEFMNAAVKIYFIPKTDTALATFSAANHTRMVLEAYDHNYDEASGVLTLQCRDTWFKDKEISRRVDSGVFTDLDPQWENEYGSTYFGTPDDAANGVINCPFLESGIDGSDRPYAKIFTGWTFPSHPNNALSTLYVRNQYPDIVNEQWHTLGLASDPQSAYDGDATQSDYGVDANRLLSRYSYARVWDPLSWDDFIIPPYSSSDALVLTSVRAAAVKQEYYWCPYFTGGTRLSNGEIAKQLSLSRSWSMAFWVYLPSKGSSQTLVCRERDGTERAFEVYYDSGSDRFKFDVFATGGGTYMSVSANTHGSPSTSNTVFIQVAYDHATPRVLIRVDNGTADTSTSTTGAANSTRAGLRIGGRGQNDRNLTGSVLMIGAWEEYQTAASLFDSIYNGTTGKFSWDLTDTDRDGVIAYWNTTEQAGIRKDSFGGYDLVESSSPVAVARIGFKQEALTANDGELSLSVWTCTYDSDSDRWQPVRELRRSVFDHMSIGANTIPYFQIDPPLVLSPSETVRYWFQIDWSGRNAEGRAMQVNYEGLSGERMYRRAIDTARGTNQGWERIDDFKLSMEFYMLGQGDDSWKDSTTSGTPRYSYQHLEAKSITLESGQAHKEFNNDLDFKARIIGIEDDGSGTYTGSANAVISNPADLVHYVCRNSDFGMGLSTGVLNTTSFAAVRVLAAAFGLTLALDIDSTLSARDLILILCRQSRMRFYKQRDGKLALNWPVSIGVPSVSLSEAILRAELQLVEDTQDDEASVINDLTLLYARDGMNLPKDPAFLRKAQTDKYSGLVYQSATASTDTDSARAANFTLSQSLYGKRELKEALDCYDTEAEALKIKGYLADRYYKRRKRKTIRIPRKRYYSTLDLFSTAEMQHTGIPTQGGSTWTMKATDAGTPVTLYFEGTPITLWAGGTFQGECVAVQEQGAFMTLTVEEVPSLPG